MYRTRQILPDTHTHTHIKIWDGSDPNLVRRAF